MIFPWQDCVLTLVRGKDAVEIDTDELEEEKEKGEEKVSSLPQQF